MINIGIQGYTSRSKTNGQGVDAYFVFWLAHALINLQEQLRPPVYLGVKVGDSYTGNRKLMLYRKQKLQEWYHLT